MAASGLPAALVARTAFLLGRLGTDAQARFAAALAPLGLKPKHYAVLELLDEAGAGAQRTIADTLRIDPSLIVAVVDDLERRRAVRRKRDSRDRRRVTVSLTSAGRTLLASCRALADDVNEQLLTPLTDLDRRTLHALLTVLARDDPEFPFIDN